MCLKLVINAKLDMFPESQCEECWMQTGEAFTYWLHYFVSDSESWNTADVILLRSFICYLQYLSRSKRIVLNINIFLKILYWPSVPFMFFICIIHPWTNELFPKLKCAAKIMPKRRNRPTLAKKKHRVAILTLTKCSLAIKHCEREIKNTELNLHAVTWQLI